MEAIDLHDISTLTEFKVGKDTLTKERCVDEERHMYLFKRTNSQGILIGYELVRGVRRKNPDGSIVYIYPSSSLFGNYAYYIAKAYAERDIPKYIQKMLAVPSKSLKDFNKGE